MRRYGPYYRGSFERGPYGGARGYGETGWWPWSTRDHAGPGSEVSCARRLGHGPGEPMQRADEPVLEPAQFAFERQRCELDAACRLTVARERRGATLVWVPRCVSIR